MRELHGYHGEHRRHAHDAAAATDASGKHARDRAHEAPKHASHDSPKFKILWDPEARKAERLKYEQKVEAAEAEYAARHAKPKAGDQARVPEQRKPQEAKPEHAPPESRDKPASKIAERRDPPESQREERRKPERSWLPLADAVKAISDIGTLATAFAVALGGASAKWDAVVVAGATAVVSNVAWANRRRKEKHGDRSEG
jgi:hypothetical protein